AKDGEWRRLGGQCGGGGHQRVSVLDWVAGIVPSADERWLTSGVVLLTARGRRGTAFGRRSLGRGPGCRRLGAHLAQRLVIDSAEARQLADRGRPSRALAPLTAGERT